MGIKNDDRDRRGRGIPDVLKGTTLGSVIIDGELGNHIYQRGNRRPHAHFPLLSEHLRPSNVHTNFSRLDTQQYCLMARVYSPLTNADPMHR